MPSANLLASLLLELQRAPLDHASWGSFFQRLCEATNCKTGVFTTSSANGNEALAGGGSDYDPTLLQLYNEHYAPLDPLFEPCMRNLRRAVITDQELIRRDAYLKTEFYNELLVPFGLHYVTVVPCFFDENRRDFITMFRGYRRGAVDSESSKLLSCLIPHMTATLKIHHLLVEANVQSRLLQASLERSRAATFILGSQGKVRYMNRQAESLVRYGQSVTVKGGRLRAMRPSDDCKLAALISASTHANTGSKVINGQIAPFMLLPRPARPPLHLTMISVPNPAQHSFNERVAICLIADPFQKEVVSHEALSIFFHLTAVETDLVKLLLRDVPLKEAASTLRISYDSVRFHLKNVFRKTGTRRQAELVRIVMALNEMI